MDNYKYLRRVLGIALAVGIAASATGCDNFLEITNENNLEAEGIDPAKDANLLGLSVYQQWVSDIGEFSVYVGWYTASAWVGDTYPTRNDFGRRDLPWNNGHVNDFWNNFGDNLYFARTTIASVQDAGNTVDLAKAWFVSGETIRLMAETMCAGTIADFSVDPIEPRGPMTVEMLLDSAIADLTTAKTVAQAAGGADGTEIAMAAQVHIARAHLQAGRRSEASAAAAGVPADFVFEIWHLDDSSNRNLGNNVWSFSENRISLVTPPEFRAMADAGDPRIAYTDMGRVAQDGFLTFFRQGKYQGWADFERWASGLEARYIKVEADQNAAAMLAFINERRAVGNQGDFTPTTDMGLLMTELLEQKTRDFWLESTQRMADFRRVPQYMSYIIPPGEDTYYKPALGVVRDQNCWPVPRDECENNLNFQGSAWCVG
ncbi:MAG: hypothetical protein MUO50_09640 [Longimicrobiales bacterium]|nr:hypothetical protein [Longimicrobiales bacterium]